MNFAEYTSTGCAFSFCSNFDLHTTVESSVAVTTGVWCECRRKPGAWRQRKRWWSRDVGPEARLPTHHVIAGGGAVGVASSDVDVVVVDAGRRGTCAGHLLLVHVQRLHVPTPGCRRRTGTASRRRRGSSGPRDSAEIAQSVVQRPPFRRPALPAAAAAAAGAGRAAGQRARDRSDSGLVGRASSWAAPTRQLDARQTPSLNSSTCLHQPARRWRHYPRMRRRLPTNRTSGLRRVNTARLGDRRRCTSSSVRFYRA